MSRKKRPKKNRKKYWAPSLGEGHGPPYRSSALPENLEGHVFLVGNTILGIPRHLKLRHPCCVIYEEGEKVYVSKGTSLANVLPHYRGHYVVVYPDETNGLAKPTAFEKFRRYLPRRSLFREDCLGSLSDKDFERIREALHSDG